MKFVSVVSGCYNEEGNIRELYERVCRVFANELADYTFEFIIIDNASQDGTVKILKEIAALDKRFKVIVNNRNFGHVRSPYHAILQASGEAISVPGIGSGRSAGDAAAVRPQVGGRLQGRSGAEDLERGILRFLSGSQVLLLSGQSPVGCSADQERDRFWTLRPPGDRRHPQNRRPLPVFPRA